MKYYKYIEIDNFKIIQEKTLEFLVKNNLLNNAGLYFIPWKEYTLEVSEILTAFDRYKIKPIQGATYITTEQNDSKVHIDYVTQAQHLCRINIPILNCVGSKTEFFKVPMKEFYVNKQEYNNKFFFQIKDNATLVEKVDEVEIIYPTVIKIQQPHRVHTNLVTVPRVCLTLTMDKDPVFLLEDDQIYLTQNQF